MKNKSSGDSSTKPKGLYLHASSVHINGQALLFLGHSTAGKSTISQLLSKRYTIIADDTVWLSKRNYEWVVHDESIRFQFQENNSKPADSFKAFPLLALIRIYKSDTMDIQPISPKAACSHLIDAVFEVDSQRKQMDITVKKKWFSMLADISNRIQGWHLTFKKDISIINLINEIFDKK